MACEPALMDIRDDGDGQPPIPAVCIIPEKPPPAARADDGGIRRAEAYYDALLTFARRFERAFMLHVVEGLVPLDVLTEMSDKKYTDLKPYARHVLWGKVRDQVQAQLPAGQRVVCLLTGEQMRGFIKLGFPTTCPLTGMSAPHRCYWVMDRNRESNFAVALATFGLPAVPLKVNPAATRPSKAATS